MGSLNEATSLPEGSAEPPSRCERIRELEKRLLPRQPPGQRAVLRRREHPQLAKRHRAALGRLADEPRELDACEPRGAELLDVEQLGVQRDDVGAARAAGAAGED